MSCSRVTWGFAAVVSGIALIYLCLPLGTAFQFGGDEGYQLITSFLMSKGFALYKEIWSDQPPVFVLLLDWGFKLCNPSIVVARVIAAGFGLLMFAAFYEVVRLRSNQWQGLLAAFFLLASPGALELSVSVMQEVPTFALALVSALWLFYWRRHPHWSLLTVSGVAMGIALGTKLTAVIVAPAMILEVWLQSRARHKVAWFKAFSASAIHWSAAAGITLTVITWVWGQGSFQTSYRAHFVEHPVYGLERPEDFPMPVSVFFDHAECILAAAIGCVLALRRHRLRDFAFPLTWLGTALAIHLVHRPWWMYYYLHLAIPMAWLAGFAVKEMITSFLNLPAGTRSKSPTTRSWMPFTLAVVSALALARSAKRLEVEVKDLRARAPADENSIVSKMKAYAPHTHWVYVRYTQEAYAFHARLPMPPELAMVTLKRFWSDQISAEEIVSTCERYRPEQLLLSPREATGIWTNLLTHYEVAYKDADSVLYQRILTP